MEAKELFLKAIETANKSGLFVELKYHCELDELDDTMMKMPPEYKHYLAAININGSTEMRERVFGKDCNERKDEAYIKLLEHLILIALPILVKEHEKFWEEYKKENKL